MLLEKRKAAKLLSPLLKEKNLRMTDLIKSEYICRDCGLEYGSIDNSKKAEWQFSKCMICEETTDVTQPKIFFHNDQST